MAEKLGHGAFNGAIIELPRESIDSLRRVLSSRLSCALQFMGFGKDPPQDLMFTPPPRLVQNIAVYDSYKKYLPSQLDQKSSNSNRTSHFNTLDSIRPILRTLLRRAILQRSPDAPMNHDDIDPTYDSDSPFLRRLALATIILAAICLVSLIVWFFVRRFQRNKRLRKMKEEHGEPKEVHMMDHKAEQYEPPPRPPPGPPWSAAPEARFHDVRL